MCVCWREAEEAGWDTQYIIHNGNHYKYNSPALVTSWSPSEGPLEVTTVLWPTHSVLFLLVTFFFFLILGGTTSKHFLSSLEELAVCPKNTSKKAVLVGQLRLVQLSAVI